MEKAKLDSKTQRMLSREIASMEKLHHPNLVRLFEVIESFSKVYLVMEYASQGELYQRITSGGRFREEKAKPLFAQIVSAIDHMVRGEDASLSAHFLFFFLCATTVSLSPPASSLPHLVILISTSTTSSTGTSKRRTCSSLMQNRSK